MSRPALSPRPPWRDRRVVLGVTGGIAAYKAVQLARDLTRLGAEVDTVMTRGAQRFVTPLTFEAVTGRPVVSNLFSAEGAARHIRLAREADAICVAPATADFMARAAQGRADDLLTTVLLAAEVPVVLCPAMNDSMFRHPQTRANLSHLRDGLGYRIAGPAIGPLAYGEGVGPGRMIEPEEILEHVGRALGAPGLDGRKVLVTAGPTHEAVDPVRFLGNRSSGKMGFALAGAAWRRGADVSLVSGPVALEDPPGVETVRVESAIQMLDAILALAPEADVLVFAAAVSDFRPVREAAHKLKRGALEGGLTIETAPNPDVALESIVRRKPGAIAVGFALETEDLLANARIKLERKHFDLIVANSALEPGSGFGGDSNRATLLSASGTADALPLMSKDELAERIWDRVIELSGGRS